MLSQDETHISQATRSTLSGGKDQTEQQDCYSEMLTAWSLTGGLGEIVITVRKADTTSRHT